MSRQPDNALMLRVQAGDLEAFAQLVARFQNMVYGLTLSILRRREDAEEAAQDAFVKLFRARDSFDSQKSFEPWLLRIAGNASRDKLRRRRVNETPMQRNDEDELFEYADPRTTPDPGLQDGEAVRQALDGLSQKVRLPLELKYLRGLTNQQIASALEISVSNVKVQIARGKDILASRLEGKLQS
ncbi:MAG: sigma-70 family RNA polymerase sigma factor [Planctomycetes bacterium]|nr:sigma-70 family RNA polymerase sigma factor [Planctomycetota bacterium]